MLTHTRFLSLSVTPSPKGLFLLRRPIHHSNCRPAAPNLKQSQTLPTLPFRSVRTLYFLGILGQASQGGGKSGIPKTTEKYSWPFEMRVAPTITSPTKTSQPASENATSQRSVITGSARLKMHPQTSRASMEMYGDVTTSHLSSIIRYHKILFWSTDKSLSTAVTPPGTTCIQVAIPLVAPVTSPASPSATFSIPLSSPVHRMRRSNFWFLRWLVLTNNVRSKLMNRPLVTVYATLYDLFGLVY